MTRKLRFPLVVSLVIAVAVGSLVIPVLRGDSPIALGLDLGGGVIVTYRPDFSTRLDVYDDLSEDELLVLAKETLSSRLSRTLKTIPEVVVRDDQRIVVSVPGEQDRRRVLEVVGETYQLTLRLVLEPGERGSQADAPPFPFRGRLLELGPADFSGQMLDERSIQVTADESGELLAQPSVQFRFRAPYDAEFESFTSQNVGRQLAILIDDEVQWVGTIESAIRDSGVLRGTSTVAEATEVATMLRSGTLPMSLSVESLSAVTSSLGQEIQRSGLWALLLAVALLVVVLAIAYLHRGWFLLSGVASLFCLLLLIAGLAAALKLPLDVVGIAGLILSVGMGMDAFIIVFEALEARLGGESADRLKRHPAAAARGAYSFNAEGRTLFHANVTTLLVILLLLGTERLESFALFIAIGLLASVVTIFFTRELLSRGPSRMLEGGVDPLARFRRLRPRIFRLRWVYAALLVVGLALSSVAMLRGRSLVLGDDFRAGIQLTVRGAAEGVDGALEELRTRLPAVSVRSQRLGALEGPGSSPGGAAGRYLMTLGTTLGERLTHRVPEVLSPGGAGEVTGTVTAAELMQTLAAASVEVESLHGIDGRVSARRMLESLRVLGLSFALLAFYFVVCKPAIDRFFGASGRRDSLTAPARLLVFAGILLAVVADLLVVLMALLWLGIAINLPVIAALLTIIGYSVNDSVVLWGHIDSRRFVSPGESGGCSAKAVVTKAVDAILGRAVLTSVSTAVPALTILVVGLTPLLDFARVMIVGTVAGTLSSLFVLGHFAVLALTRQGGVPVRVGRAGVAAGIR